ncbi:hypothetical protein ACFLU5_01745 [Bacteroidota bacterium]
MKNIEIYEVKNRNDLQKFIKFPDQLYAKNDFFIPAIHKSEYRTLSHKTNPAFEYCISKYWLAKSQGRIVGRIAGIINTKYNDHHNIKYARFGWLDFIEDDDVLRLLLQTVETWALENNMEYVHGPLGFVSFDPSGILIEGFDEFPTSVALYNYPYYAKLIEKCEYTKEKEWIEYNITVPDEVPENVVRSAELIKRRYKLHEVEINNRKDILKYSNDVFNLINIAYKDLFIFSELSPQEAAIFSKQFLGFLKPEFVSFILDENEEMVAFGIVTPSIAKALKKCNGKLFPFGFLRIMRALKKTDTADLLLIAINPAYQNRGLHAIIFNKITRNLILNNIKKVESNREEEDNIKVKNLWNHYEHRMHKRVRCYSKKLI